VKAISLPLGLQAGLVSMPGELVNRLSSEPSRRAVKISMLAPSPRAKTIRRPSGEKEGEVLSEPLVTTGALRPLATSAR